MMLRDEIHFHLRHQLIRPKILLIFDILLRYADVALICSISGVNDSCVMIS